MPFPTNPILTMGRKSLSQGILTKSSYTKEKMGKVNTLADQFRSTGRFYPLTRRKTKMANI